MLVGFSMVKFVPDNMESSPGETCLAIVLYEGSAAREFVARSSRELSERNQPGGPVEVRWSSLSALADADSARDLAQHAARADLVVFAGACTGDWPDEVKLWIESWIGQRGEREGAIVGVVIPESSVGPVEIASLKEIYLRHVAHRAGMDYLCHVPAAISKGIPDSLEYCSARAGQITSLLDEILSASAHQSTLRR
jgi:hypothetical protein